MKRFLRLYICDYEKNIVCNLYDSEANVQGQAYDVYIDRDRTDYRELSFELPSKIVTENGNEDNYRVDLLIADYLIQAVTKDRSTKEEVKDYYIISEPKITHNPFTKEVSVTAKHISQLLTNKNLELEFSDTEGNNVGTADVLLDIILDGTGWTKGEVAIFKEDDSDKVKVRSLSAQAGTGALKLISILCEKFDAKPVYHGDTQTVDLLPLNPFSESTDEEIISQLMEQGIEVVEVNFKRNMKSISRTLNTDNMLTKFYVYGSYGDYMTGYCGIKTCSHHENLYNFGALQPGEYRVNLGGSIYYFLLEQRVAADKTWIWSDLDFLSRSYLWDGETAHELYKEPKTDSITPVDPILLETKTIKNNVPYLMSFSYYRESGLLKDHQFQYLAEYQRNMPLLYEASETAATNKNTHLQELSEVAESSTGFLKLAVSNYSTHSGSLKININTEEGDHGVLYRSDYDEKKRNFFSWYVADQLKPNGDAVNGGSKILIVHDTTPVTWEFAYVKEIYHMVDGHEELIVDADNNPTHFIYELTEGEEPSSVVLWQDPVTFSSTDAVFLFCTNSMSGLLGSCMATEEAIIQSLNKKLNLETVAHDVIFTDTKQPIKNTTIFIDAVNTFGWLYNYDNFSASHSDGTLYYVDFDRSVNTWRQVVFANTQPALQVGQFFFDEKKKTLWYGTDTGWAKMDSKTDQERARLFSYVYQQCKERDVIYKGWYEEYTNTFSPALPVGNYAMQNEYGSYWLFTTTQAITEARFVYAYKHLYQDSDPNHVVPVSIYPFDTVDFPTDNCLSEAIYAKGRITNAGMELASEEYMRTNYLRAYTNRTYTYSFDVGNTEYKVFFYDQNKRFISYQSLNGSSFTTPAAPGIPTSPDGNYVGQTYYMRLCYKGTLSLSINSNIYIQDRFNVLIAGKDTFYKILPAVGEQGGFTGQGTYLGINNLMKQFQNVADQVYEHDIPDLEAAQEAIKNENNTLTETLGYMLREGTWRDDSYAEGDEDRLYKDAMDNFKEVSRPEATYEISYIDPYHVNNGSNYSAADQTNIFDQEVETTDAVHLIDEDLHESRWAYIDRCKTCYDMPEKSSIQINTRLSTIGQRTFTDIMSHIVDVAKDFEAKQTVYERAVAIGTNGEIAAEKLSGKLNAYRTLITGGSSNWYTDQNGNIVFEAVDNSSAMMLAGAGLLISNSKDEYGEWQWQTAATGDGIVADSITTGLLTARLIEAGSITTDKLSSAVGEQLDISSNVALNLFATTDGSRPAGSLITTHPEAGQSWISIAAATETEPAAIAIKSGGQINIESNGELNLTSGEMNLSGSEMNLSGSSINIEAGAELNLFGGILNINSEGELNIGSDSSVNITSGGQLDISSTGKFTINSENFKVLEDGSVRVDGTLYGYSGNIGGWRLYNDQYDPDQQQTQLLRRLEAGSNTVGSTNYVAIDAGSLFSSQPGAEPTNMTPYVIWAGDTRADYAPFAVERSGNVYLDGTIMSDNARLAVWHIDSESISTVTENDQFQVSSFSSTMYSASVSENNKPFLTKIALTSDEIALGSFTYPDASHAVSIIWSKPNEAHSPDNATKVGQYGLNMNEFDQYWDPKLRLKSDGTLISRAGTFDNATIQSGTIGGWQIVGNTLKSDTFIIDSSNKYIKADNWTINNNGLSFATMIRGFPINFSLYSTEERPSLASSDCALVITPSYLYSGSTLQDVMPNISILNGHNGLYIGRDHISPAYTSSGFSPLYDIKDFDRIESKFSMSTQTMYCSYISTPGDGSGVTPTLVIGNDILVRGNITYTGDIRKQVTN